MRKTIIAATLIALTSFAAQAQTYFQAPFADNSGCVPSGCTPTSGSWVARSDLGTLPSNNDDPELVKTRELINEADGNDQKYFPLGLTVNYVNDAYGTGSL